MCESASPWPRMTSSYSISPSDKSSNLTSSALTSSRSSRDEAFHDFSALATSARPHPAPSPAPLAGSGPYPLLPSPTGIPPPPAGNTGTPPPGAAARVGHIVLHGVPIVSLQMEGKERLCLAQISNTLLKHYSYNEIHNRRVALGITCVQCTPVQLEVLRRAGAMPVSSRRCGMITKREAERLVKSFLDDTTPPKLPDDFVFDVEHHCGWGCRGSFVPPRYNSSRAKCIRCRYCDAYFSPNKFIFHFHRSPGAKYNHPDAANFNSWRRHLTVVTGGGEGADTGLLHAWEDVKAMFNGGNRRRAVRHGGSAAGEGRAAGGEGRAAGGSQRSRRRRPVNAEADLESENSSDVVRFGKIEKYSSEHDESRLESTISETETGRADAVFDTYRSRAETAGKSGRLRDSNGNEMAEMESSDAQKCVSQEQQLPSFCGSFAMDNASTLLKANYVPVTFAHRAESNMILSDPEVGNFTANMVHDRVGYSYANRFYDGIDEIKRSPAIDYMVQTSEPPDSLHGFHTAGLRSPYLPPCSVPRLSDMSLFLPSNPSMVTVIGDDRPRGSSNEKLPATGVVAMRPKRQSPPIRFLAENLAISAISKDASTICKSAVHGQKVDNDGFEGVEENLSNPLRKDSAEHSQERDDRVKIGEDLFASDNEEECIDVDTVDDVTRSDDSPFEPHDVASKREGEYFVREVRVALDQEQKAGLFCDKEMEGDSSDLSKMSERVSVKHRLNREPHEHSDAEHNASKVKLNVALLGERGRLKNKILTIDPSEEQVNAINEEMLKREHKREYREEITQRRRAEDDWRQTQDSLFRQLEQERMTRFAFQEQLREAREMLQSLLSAPSLLLSPPPSCCALCSLKAKELQLALPNSLFPAPLPYRDPPPLPPGVHCTFAGTAHAPSSVAMYLSYANINK